MVRLGEMTAGIKIVDRNTVWEMADDTKHHKVQPHCSSGLFPSQVQLWMMATENEQEKAERYLQITGLEMITKSAKRTS